MYSPRRLERAKGRGFEDSRLVLEPHSSEFRDLHLRITRVYVLIRADRYGYGRDELFCVALGAKAALVAVAPVRLLVSDEVSARTTRTGCSQRH